MKKPFRDITEKLETHRDNLPHWQIGGSTYFVTFRSSRGALSDGAISLVKDHILFDHGRQMDLHFGVVMPDHAHLILQPRKKSDSAWFDLSLILKGIKGSSARSINKLLGTKGTVWQDESYDRILRDEKEYWEKVNYMLWNPVKAGLTDDPYKYPHLLNPMKIVT